MTTAARMAVKPAELLTGMKCQLNTQFLTDCNMASMRSTPTFLFTDSKDGQNDCSQTFVSISHRLRSLPRCSSELILKLALRRILREFLGLVLGANRGFCVHRTPGCRATICIHVSRRSTSYFLLFILSLCSSS